MTPTIIEAMHAQWEIAWEAHHINDVRKSEPSTMIAHSIRRDRAMRNSHAEYQHLQFAILYQVPTTMRDAAILQFHINGVISSNDHQSTTEEEQTAIEIASNTLLVFMAEQVAEPIGPAFAHSVEFSRIERDFRTERKEVA